MSQFVFVVVDRNGKTTSINATRAVAQAKVDRFNADPFIAPGQPDPAAPYSIHEWIVTGGEPVVDSGEPGEAVEMTIQLARSEAERFLRDHCFSLTSDDEIKDVVDCTVEGDPPENVYHYATIGKLRPVATSVELGNVVVDAWNKTFRGHFDSEGQPLHDFESWEMTTEEDKRRILEFAGLLLDREVEL